MTLRQKRHAAALNTLDRTIRQRDKCIAKLVRLEAKLKLTRRQVSRLERDAAKPEPVKPAPTSIDIADLHTSNHPIAKANAESWQAVTGKPKPTPGPIPPAVTESGIPDFLRRAAKASDAKDVEAAAAIKAEQAERKAAKARGRIAKLKAKQSGDTKRMPLTGREALNYLRTGSRT